MAEHIRDKMVRALDVIQPDWYTQYATQQDLAECARSCTDGRSGTVQAREKLRRDTVERMWNIIRAGVEAGITEYRSETRG